jgi:hypothetical protein
MKLSAVSFKSDGKPVAQAEATSVIWLNAEGYGSRLDLLERKSCCE